MSPDRNDVLQPSARGFSLLELTVAAALLGIAASLAMPSLSAMAQKRAANAEVRSVRAELLAARDLARAKLVCVRVRRPTPATLNITELSGGTTTSCGSTAGAVRVLVFDAARLEIATDVDLLFNGRGALVTPTTDTVDIALVAKTTSSNATSVLRIYGAVGLTEDL
jgi:prepilin-type N-terminal cleavage/methylation domain-containing protein